MLNLSQQKYYLEDADIKPVTVIGAGSVGSHVVSMLVRIGITDITVYDHDSIESHNVAPSLYGEEDFGLYKVDALAAIILRDTGVAIKVVRKRYEGEPLKRTVIMCVDTMEARQLVWKKVRNNPLVDVLIDTRIAEEFWQLFAISPCNQKEIAYYEHYLNYSTSEAAPQMCGLHSIIDVSIAVAAEAACVLRSFWKRGTKNWHVERLCGGEISIYPPLEF